jgi:uncharacterized protein
MAGDSQAHPGLKLALCLLGVFLLGAACERDTSVTTPNGSVLELPEGFEPLDFDLVTLEISTAEAVHTLTAEVAETPRQIERGLMFRTSMPEDAGMIFIFEGERSSGFWMFNTLIPLSVAYIDARGEIVDIQDMEPCGNPDPRDPSACPGYPPAAPYRYALEVNQGYFAERDIGVGDSVSFIRQ